MLEKGTEIGKWRVTREIGRGAMAGVYEVRHLQLGSRAALKVLSSASPKLRARLLREGRTQSTLEHPNILRVRDVLEFQGRPALLMDYVDGPDLRGWSKAERSIDAIQAMLRQVASAMAAAHAAGIVHRDLKPANILIAPGDTPRIADFGIAKVLDDPDTGTRSGVAMGTPAYMAPEQIRNAADSDARADVYALGVIAWELLTGERPIAFHTDIIAAWQDKMAGPAQSIRDVHPDCPEGLATAIDAALVGPRENRLASVEDFLRLMDGTLAPQTVLETTTAEATFFDVETGIEASDLLAKYTVEQAYRDGPVVYSWRARPVADASSAVFVKGIVLPAADAKDVELAEREAAVLRQIDHPAIPRFVELFHGFHGGKPMLFVVREWVEGLPLALELQEKRYTEEDVLDILDEVGGILGYLHGLEPPVVHRDVQPDNLIRRPDGRLALVDFGSVRDALLDTLGGDTVVGTFGYMAPEQFAGDATPATDTYGLGALAVALLGRRDPRELMDATRRFNWRDVVDASPAVETMLEKLLADAPEERFSDARAAQDAVRDARVALKTAPGESNDGMDDARALFEPQVDQLPAVASPPLVLPPNAAETGRTVARAGIAVALLLMVGLGLFMVSLVVTMGASLLRAGPPPTPIEQPIDDDEQRGEFVLDEPSRHCMEGFPFVDHPPGAPVDVRVRWRQGRVEFAAVEGAAAGSPPSICLEKTLPGLTVADARSDAETLSFVTGSPRTKSATSPDSIPRLEDQLQAALWNAPAVQACYDAIDRGDDAAAPLVELHVTAEGIQSAFVHDDTPMSRCLTRAAFDVETGPLDLTMTDALLEDGTRGDTLLQRARVVFNLQRPLDPEGQGQVDLVADSLTRSGLKSCLDAYHTADPAGEQLTVRVLLDEVGVEWLGSDHSGTAVERCLLKRLEAFDWSPLIEKGMPSIKLKSPMPEAPPE
jgi:serine/threonine protein kinase